MTLDQMRRSLVDTSVRQSDGPSLKETLDWLKEKIPLGTVHFEHSLSDGERAYVYSVNRQSTVWSMDSCLVVIGELSSSMPVSHPNGVPDVITVRYTLPLGVLAGGYVVHEPATAQQVSPLLVGNNGRTTFGWNGPKEISLAVSMSGPSPRSEASTTDHLFLIFNDESLAQRVLQAFNHAASLCRKKEVF